jgi:hypothetical protein
MYLIRKTFMDSIINKHEHLGGFHYSEGRPPVVPSVLLKGALHNLHGRWLAGCIFDLDGIKTRIQIKIRKNGSWSHIPVVSIASRRE